uniref:Uncharacterized protein n=1 Tax=Anguilla anguilla TaxID=7936 RepID=A0A0E9TSU3_ANGAN
MQMKFKQTIKQKDQKQYKIPSDIY